jgi:prepilin-type N-terminal cleavage/methylation domain-containing protein
MQRGFTLIEFMVFIVIGAVLVAIAMPVMFGQSSLSNQSVSWGINGVTESRCIEGYKFVIGEHGHPRQILDEFGKGVRCEKATNPSF